MAELSVIEQNPVEFFTGDGLNKILIEIEKEALSRVYEVDSAKGRKEIASAAYKVSQSKSYLDAQGKKLVVDWKAKAKTVDSSRKKARDFLDRVRDQVRKPLTDWEIQEKAKEDARLLQLEINHCHDEALAMNELFNREKEIEKKQQELAAQEAAIRQAEESARIKKESEEKAYKEAQATIEREREKAERAERERIAAEERAKLEKEAAVKAAEDRLKKQAEEKERDRLECEAREKKEAERLAANKEHRKNINNEIISCFVAGGINVDTGKKIIRLIACGKINHISINYYSDTI